ncbi:glycosyltransferase family 2 protein [Desulfomicrobium norvegicum]|nr:glycosyltransferase [Desulfomicrobium norvegicum]
MVEEQSFQADFIRIIENGPPYVLVGCDDVFFTRPFDPAEIIDALATDSELFAVSLRLGRNIRPMPASLEAYGPFLRFDWRHCRVPQWNYPFDVSASVYRRDDLLRILREFSNLRTPNFLEGNVAQAIEHGAYAVKPGLACYPLSRSLTLTINRVQETHQNLFDNANLSSPEQLQAAFDQGSVLDTERFAGALNHHIHTDSRYFGLRQLTEYPVREPVPGLVTVICYTYNRSQYLPKMIASVLGQDYTNIEFLVYDDCSTEDLAAVVAPFLSDPRLRFIKGEYNLGGSGAFDQLCDICLELTRGEFVCFVGDDDIFVPHKISRQLAYFAEHPKTDALFCDARFIDAKGRPRKGEFRNAVALGFSSANLARLQLHNNSFAHPCVMMRRSSIKLVGGFACGKASFCADYHMWSKIAPFLNVAFLDEKLVAYRIHGGNESLAKVHMCRQSTLDCKFDLYKRFTIYDFFPELYATNCDAASLSSAFVELGNLILGAPFSYPALAAHCYEIASRHRGNQVARVNGLIALALDGRGQEVRLKAPAILAAVTGLPDAQADAARVLIGQALSATRGKLDNFKNVRLLRESPNASALRRMLG